MLIADEKSELLRASWALAIADKGALARLFYSKLFLLAPETEKLFTQDMAAQGRKLAATLGFIIDNLDETDALLSAARELAIRHISYNVEAAQYGFVGQALVETLDEILGPRFDKDTKDAWVEVYELLANHMIKSAYSE